MLNRLLRPFGALSSLCLFSGVSDILLRIEQLSKHKIEELKEAQKESRSIQLLFKMLCESHKNKA